MSRRTNQDEPKAPLTLDLSDESQETIIRRPVTARKDPAATLASPRPVSHDAEDEYELDHVYKSLVSQRGVSQRDVSQAAESGIKKFRHPSASRPRPGFFPESREMEN